jgi:uncharacterized membrane protein
MSTTGWTWRLRDWVLLFALCLAGLFAAAPARAELSFCNETGETQWVAVGYKSGENWVSEGWWEISSGDCKAPIPGDLTNRHYYYRLFSDSFEGEGFKFCVKRDVFRSEGDENCAARGFDSGDFADIDTGPDALSFTLTLTAPQPAKSSEAKSAPQASDPYVAAGTYGEPLSLQGKLDGCERIDGLLYCYVMADGWRYVAYDDERTPVELLDELDAMQPGSNVAIAADLLSQGDVSVDMVLREVLQVADDDPEQLIVGYWTSRDDSAAAMNIMGDGTLVDLYDANLTGEFDYFLRDSCLDAAPSETLHLVTIEKDSGDTYCYEVLTLSSTWLELMYLPRGNILTYVRD